MTTVREATADSTKGLLLLAVFRKKIPLDALPPDGKCEDSDSQLAEGDG